LPKDIPLHKLEIVKGEEGFSVLDNDIGELEKIIQE
jgi:hypothetical protein